MSIFDQYEDQLGGELNREETVDYVPVHVQPESRQELTDPPPDHRVKNFSVIAAVILILLLVRLISVQIISGHANATLARENSVRQIVDPSLRGAILDTRGEWLARNVARFKVQITPSDLPRKSAERQAIYDAVAGDLKLTDDQNKRLFGPLEQKQMFSTDPVTIADNISHDDALVLMEKLQHLAGVAVVPQAIRQYNHPEDGLAFILGYVGNVTEEDVQNGQFRSNDEVGKSGLELSYDQALRGRDGVTEALVNSQGQVVRTVSDQTHPGDTGHNLVLHLDAKLQQVMATELKNGLEKANLKAGVAIAMNPQNGGILGMVSLPAYDDNLFAGGAIDPKAYQTLTADPTNPLFNRATQGQYPSGSVIKPYVATVGLQDGVITDKTAIDTPAEITVGPWKFPNWQKAFLHNVDVKTAIAESNDIFFYAVGGGYDKISGLGVNRLSEGLKWFGFGQKTGIDLPTESDGLVPTPDWKKDAKGESWYIGDTYHLAIGQGDLLVTPLQLVTALSAVANGGTLYEPHLVDRIVDQSGKTVQVVAPKVIKQSVADQKLVQIVREGMLKTNTDGSGRQLASLPVKSGGKTGTAQVGASNEFLHSWYEVFAPYDNPTIALVVLGEKGSQENEGHTTAVPIAKAILEQYFNPGFGK